MTHTYPINASLASNAHGRTVVIRHATIVDLPSIVNIHQKAFRNYFLTRLGGVFLCRYYSLALRYCSGIVLVSERRALVDGFVCGFVEPAKFYQLMWRNRAVFVLPLLSALVRHPSLAGGVLHGVKRIQTSATKTAARLCELSAIAVTPEAGGNGLGSALIQAFLTQARSMDAECVYLTTDADENEPANALYRRLGFQRTHRFLQRKGRWMNEYIIHRLT